MPEVTASASGVPRLDGARALTQRIGVSFHLVPLSVEDTRAYVAHRLAVAGAERSLFNEQAIRRLHAATAGVPRLINHVATQALVEGMARGADEIAAEEARIRQAAEATRARLLEQTRREVDQRVRVARQELLREAADLAVGVAAERIQRDLTPEGHLRLVDRYAEQVQQTGSDRE